MQKLFLSLMLSLAACSTATAAQTASPDLSQCIADSTTGKDRKDFIRWMFAAMAQHPAMSDIANISPEQISEINQTVAHIFERLVVSDCNAAFKAVNGNGEGTAVREAFEYFGRLAAQEMFSHPSVRSSLDDLSGYIDEKKIRKALGE